MAVAMKTLGAALLAAAIAGCGPAPVSEPAPVVEEPVAAPAATPPPPPGAPVVWTLSDADTTIHLFGTVHLLKPGTEWRSEAFDAAFSAADTVFFEADVRSEEAQAAILPIITEFGLYTDGGSLTATLDADDEKEVAEAAELLGVPLSALDTMKPWMAGVQLANLQITKEGYDPNSGVEVILGNEAEAAGKTLGYFETAAEQLMFFGELPMEDQIDFLVAGAEQIEDDPKMLDRLVVDWAEGDVAGIAEAMADPRALGSSLIYDRLIVERNRAWTKRIELLLEDPGEKMVAVGAAHLAGPDSVVAMLRAEGYVVDGP